MSKGGKVPHNKAHIPNMNNGKNYNDEKSSCHIHDQKHVSADNHGIKGASSTRSPNHN